MQLLLEVVAQPRDVAGILTDGERSDHVMQRRPYGVRAGIAKRLAPADQASIGLHANQQDVVGRPGAKTFTLVTAAEGVGDLDRLAVDARDLHAFSPFSRISANSRSACARSASRLDVKRGSPAGAVARR